MGHTTPSSFSFVKRAVRHLLFERSYERYYSAAGWDQTYTDGYNLDVRDQDARYGSLLALMQRYDLGGPILDVGCGDGVLEQKFRPLSRSRMVGIDYSQEAIKLARLKGIPDCEFTCTDYRSWDAGEAFAMVVLNESLYYVEDSLGALRELSKRLTAEGVIVVSMFERLVTRRIWKALTPHYLNLQAVQVKDATHRRKWEIRVLRPPQVQPGL